MGKEQEGEHHPQTAQEHKVARALSSLEHNRALKAVAEERIGKAEHRVRSYLLLYGFTSARLAGFQIELDGDELHLTRLPADEEAEQLAFWLAEPAPGTEEAVPPPAEPPTPQQVELIAQANASELPCPIGGEPLKARLTQPEEDTAGMLLYCACGFKEV
jgi:hypothetical protein